MNLAAFNGTAFVPVTIVPALESLNFVAGLAFVNGDPVVAGGSTDISGVDVRRFHNGAWEPPATFPTPRAGSLTLIPDGNSVLVGESTFSFGQFFGRVTRLVFS